MANAAKAIRIHKDDVVAVALEPLSCGTEVLGVTITNDVPQGHKFALQNIESDAPIVKYGCPIGYAKEKIAKGEHVHVHNVKTGLSETAEYKYNPESSISNVPNGNLPNIMAFKRENGTIGIRNEIWIVPTVGCVNKTAQALAERANRELLSKFPGVEKFAAWTHPYGCSQMGEDHEKTRTILADLVLHPNAAAVLVLGLGCENNTVSKFKELIESKSTNSKYNQKIEYLTTQESTDEFTEGMKILEDLCNYANKYKRQEVNAKNLVIGMKCGGSDGLSGITANALCGQICDFVTNAKGNVILTEVPEMFGAEQLLMNRCKNEEIYNKTVSLINNFKNYFVRHNQVVYENPSPGNKAGGITTLEDKSLGCIQKGGKSTVCGVMNYGERLYDCAKTEDGGLFLLEGPGNDIVSTTALTSAGAHIILFTTGRGTPLGAPVPTLKIATNHSLATYKKGWIDFDSSTMIEENAIENGARDALLDLILKTANGEYKTKSEVNGTQDIAIMKEGVTL